MAVRQPTPDFLISGTVPRLKITSQLLTPGNWTFMCWAKAEGPFSSDYRDIFGVSDTNNVVGIGIYNRVNAGANGTAAIPGSTDYYFNVGDLNSDQPGLFKIPFDEWHHYALTIEDTAGTGTRCIGYFDGNIVIEGSFINAFPPTFVSFLNTRASDTDVGAVWQGEACAMKVWDARALSAFQIRREMWYYMPIDTVNLWALTPLVDWQNRTENLGAGPAWSSLGTTWVVDTTAPPGVSWDDMDVHGLTQNANLGTWTSFTNPTLSGRVPPQQRY